MYVHIVVTLCTHKVTIRHVHPIFVETHSKYTQMPFQHAAIKAANKELDEMVR